MSKPREYYGETRRRSTLISLNGGQYMAVYSISPPLDMTYEEVDEAVAVDEAFRWANGCSLGRVRDSEIMQMLQARVVELELGDMQAARAEQWEDR